MCLIELHKPVPYKHSLLIVKYDLMGMTVSQMKFRDNIANKIVGCEPTGRIITASFNGNDCLRELEFPILSLNLEIIIRKLEWCGFKTYLV